MQLSQDEAPFQMVPTLTATLGVKGYRPVVGTRDCKDVLYVFAVMNLVSGVIHANTLERLQATNRNSEISKTRRMQKAFAQHLRHVGRMHPQEAFERVELTIGNSPWHRGKLVEEALATNPHLEFYRLPSYSPNLNVIEHFWKKVRRRATHNRLFDTIADLEASVRASLCYFQTPGGRSSPSSTGARGGRSNNTASSGTCMRVPCDWSARPLSVANTDGYGSSARGTATPFSPPSEGPALRYRQSELRGQLDFHSSEKRPACAFPDHRTNGRSTPLAGVPTAFLRIAYRGRMADGAHHKHRPPPGGRLRSPLPVRGRPLADASGQDDAVPLPCRSCRRSPGGQTIERCAEPGTAARPGRVALGSIGLSVADHGTLSPCFHRPGTERPEHDIAAAAAAEPPVVASGDDDPWPAEAGRR